MTSDQKLALVCALIAMLLPLCAMFEPRHSPKRFLEMFLVWVASVAAVMVGAGMYVISGLESRP